MIPDEVMWGPDRKRAIVMGCGSDIAAQLVRRLERDEWAVSGYHHYDVPSLTPWDLLLFAQGTLEPIGPFWDCDHLDWISTIEHNALEPVYHVHRLYPHRRPGALVVFMGGTNPNEPRPGYSAYHLSKILLIAATEQLQAESRDCRFVCIGPGFFATKIHRPHDISGRMEKYSYDELYRLLMKCYVSEDVGGRHVHIGDEFVEMLKGDAGKLRRVT